MTAGVVHALLAAALFGASTPFAKLLLGEQPPVMLAGLLYAGSGLGLAAWLSLRRLIARDDVRTAPLALADLPWLAGAVFSGGIAGPVLLLTGLALIDASAASLLLNMEGVLTALLAWFVFREPFDRRIFAGMLLIIAGGVLLSWEGSGAQPGNGLSWGALCVVAACLCWAIDNNLTRKVSAGDAALIAAIKGLVAGAANLSFAIFWMKLSLPHATSLVAAMLIGFFGYGLSLVLFVIALRHLGTARTGAYFSAAPFVGAAVSLALLGDRPEPLYWVAAGLMAAGIWLHLTESHSHEHTHEPMHHAHPHHHDAHHQHAHDFSWDGKEPHVHPHEHAPMTHAHPHYPDIHHRHEH